MGGRLPLRVSRDRVVPAASLSTSAMPLEEEVNSGRQHARLLRLDANHCASSWLWLSRGGGLRRCGLSSADYSAVTMVRYASAFALRATADRSLTHNLHSRPRLFPRRFLVLFRFQPERAAGESCGVEIALGADALEIQQD